MVIQRAVRSDIYEVMHIVRKTINEIYPKYYPHSVVDFFLEYHNWDKVCWDIEHDGVFLLRDEGEYRSIGGIENDIHITRVYTLPEFQRRGYGTAMMDELERIIAEEYDTAIVESSLSAYKMYSRRGYVPVSFHEYLTSGGGVLCYHVMEKTLNKNNHK